MRKAQEYKLSSEELRKLQRIELEMLIEVDRICRKHNIQYSLDGGTLLGAVRHKGFIPWDDDIDVIMLRKEYAKFRRVCKKELDTARFFLQDYKSDPYYRWGWAKIRRENTEHVRLGQEFLKQKTGIFIDIFVADNVPDSFLMRRLHHFLCFFIRKVLYAPLGVRQAGKRRERAVYRILSRIPRDSAFALRDRLAWACNRRDTELISHYTLEYPKSCRYGLPRRCFEEFIELEFEGHMFQAFKDYEVYLRRHYGDYRKLPTVEERVPHSKISKIDMSGVE